MPKKYSNQLLGAHSTGNPDEIYNKGIFLFKCILSKMEGNRIEVKLSFEKKQKNYLPCICYQFTALG